MNGIIDTAEDVALLRERGIVLNRLKSDDEVANLWNSMSKSVKLTKVQLLDKVIEDVNKFYNGRWKLEVDYSGWFAKYRVNLDVLPNLYPVMVNPPDDYAYTNVFSTICFLEDEKDKARLVLALPGKIVLYNLGSGMIKELVDVKHASFRDFLDGARYDTLACV
ncbi:hypothetical protein K7X08_034589 [Anisodus acutangulus]|uniref:Uncharacterized protein n=1 Tax=Anisodus acutangulus TaxID=402998 RepID=A0A9Q1LFS6_9SOLA|nr:hypothetical protein K7X08_034589 [Anisodus acutangulus]